MQHKPANIFFGVFMLTALAACGQQLTRPANDAAAEAPTAQMAAADNAAATDAPTLQAQALTAASGTTLQNYTADVSVQTTVTSPTGGTEVISSPAGLKVGYAFNGNDVKARMDVPGASFPDKRPRILMFDSATDRTALFFADTLQRDSTISQAELENLVNQQTQGIPIAEMGLNTLRVKTLDQQRAIEAQSGSTLSAASGNLYVSTSVQAFGTDGQSTTRSYFDPLQGVNTRHESTLENSKARVTSTTSVAYSGVSNIPNVKIPTAMNTQQTSTAKSLGSSVNMAQNTSFSNIQVNAVSGSYFSVGGF